MNNEYRLFSAAGNYWRILCPVTREHCSLNARRSGVPPTERDGGCGLIKSLRQCLSQKLRNCYEYFKLVLRSHKTIGGPSCTTEREIVNPCCNAEHRKSYLNLNIEYLMVRNSSARWYRPHFTDTSEHCAFCVWPSDGHQAEIEERCDLISLVTTLSGNPTQNSHR